MHTKLSLALVILALCLSHSLASIYWGAYVPSTTGDIAGFERDAKRPVSLIHWFQQWGSSYNYFDTQTANFVRSHGSIPIVTWEPWVPNGNVNQGDYNLASIINGAHDSYINSWADGAKNWGHPLFLRFAHEMNGNWYPWSERVNGNQPGQYKQAWQHIFNIFQQRGANQVTFVFCPNTVDPTTTAISELYPGDSYVHWTGVDGYNWGNTQSWSHWTPFADVFNQTYQQLTQISGKPIMIVETASTENGGNKAQWIQDAFTTQLPNNFPRVKAISWFNINKETNWFIESSGAATNAFALAINSNNGYYATNTFGNINGPITPP